MTYVKSTHSGGNGGDCVEWAVTAAGVRVRDSKDPGGPALLFDPAGWDALTAAAARDLPHPAVTVTATGDVHLRGPSATLRFTAAEWRAFTAAARDGQTTPAPI
jgi:hypothetical protein